jgi:hypothetical protein
MEIGDKSAALTASHREVCAHRRFGGGRRFRIRQSEKRSSVLGRNVLEHFPAKWIPLRVEKMGTKQGFRARCDSIELKAPDPETRKGRRDRHPLLSLCPAAMHIPP